MKLFRLMALGLCLMLSGINLSAEVDNSADTIKKQESTFKVYGNCGMCKTKIERAAIYSKGVRAAVWDEESLMLTVSYNPKKISIDDIKAAIAEVGYDTDSHRATQKAYDALHGCCKYKRP